MHLHEWCADLVSFHALFPLLSVLTSLSMFVMLFGYPPFHAEADADIFRLILAGFEPVTKKGYKAHFPTDIPCSENAKDLMARLLTSDTAKRLTGQMHLDAGGTAIVFTQQEFSFFSASLFLQLRRCWSTLG
jgi:serine/threonine protein kinase